MGMILLVVAVIVALPAALYGTRFSILWTRKRKGEKLNDHEMRLLKKNAVFALCLFVIVYGLVFKCIALFK